METVRAVPGGTGNFSERSGNPGYFVLSKLSHPEQTFYMKYVRYRDLPSNLTVSFATLIV